MIGSTVSHYRIIEKLGEGGMGIVYKAHDTTLDRVVALKFLPQRSVVTNDDSARFTNEARAAAKLTHPNIATVYEFGMADGNAFLAMEFIDGETVRKKLQLGPLSISETLRIAGEVASGLGAAHQRGIIHRDVKSENIMLTQEGGTKITDFGLAQIRGQTRIWHTVGTAGTVSYMSPEQARGEALDERTDIWSLGVVVYEMLTAKLPFPGNYEAAILYLVIHEQPQSIKSIRDDVPTKLHEVVERCLKKDPAQRYRNTEELLSDVNTLVKELDRGVQEPEEKPIEERRFETERRPVTIMFATIVAADQESEESDLEALTTGLDECFDGLASIIQKYKGMKDRILGDRLMAVFGAPAAHENDPERAVRCAQEMMFHMNRISALGVSQFSTSLQLKIGIHSGVVVAGNVGMEKGAGYSVVGDVINITAGITDLVQPGEIHLSANTLKLVSDIVEVGAARSVPLKGKTQDIIVYKLRSLKAGIEPGRRAIGTGAFVGRAEEIRLLEESLDRVQKKGEVRMFIRGEAGVGKTRVKSELTDRAQQRRMSVCEGKCTSFETNTPYFLWNTFLRSLLRVDQETPESEIRSRLHEMVKILTIESDEPYLATLLSVRYEEILLEEDEQRKGKIFNAARRLLKTYSERKPAVFLFEDLHWIDRFSQSLLEFVLSEEHLGPALIVCFYRPEYDGVKEITQVGEHLDLSRLPTEEARELMQLRLGFPLLPDRLSDLIEKRSEGNPFFIEEIIKTLLDRGIVRVEKEKLEIQFEKLESGVPETLQGVILARIDRLEERIREVLLDASVIGREFSRPVLEQIVRKKIDVMGGLKKLESLELVFEKEDARELEYLFKHYLIQEVAYNTLLQKKRKGLHSLIAEAIEKLYADRLKEFYEILAFHYEKAEEWKKAADYLSRAGRKMAESFTHEESRGFTERKEAALRQLFASEAEKPTWFYKIVSAAAIVLLLSMSLFGLLGGVNIILISFGMDGLFPRRESVPLVTGIVATLMGLALAYASFVVLKLQWTLNTIVIYEVLDEGIALVLKGGERIVVPFSDLQSMFFVAARGKSKDRWTWWRRSSAQQLTLQAVSRQPLRRYGGWVLDAALLFTAPTKEGFIGLRRKEGISVMRTHFRFGMTRKNVWKVVRNLGLTPSYTAQFFDQMHLAFTRWQTKYCLHCSAPLRIADQCSSCGYRMGEYTSTTGAVQKDLGTIRPVHNALLYILEYLINQYVPVALLISFVVLKISRISEVWALVWTVFLILPLLVIPGLQLIFKRRFESNAAIIISGSSLSCEGNIPWLDGLTIRFQDILSIKRYSNVFQRLFGLSNVEIETRNRIPVHEEIPLFHFVIPNIRESAKVVEILREKCNFLRKP